MKRLSILLCFAITTLLLFSISGCKKDKCENQYCLNGGSCSKGSGDCQCPTGYSGEHCQNYSGGGGGGGGTCTYTSYYGVQNCTQSGYVAVSATSCCPASAPYTCDGASYCYTTCKEAKDAGCGAVVYGTGQTGGGGNSGYNCNGTTCYSVSSGASYATLSQCQNNCSGGGTCNYTQWTGTGNCANTGYYPVYSNTCCPSSSPYYNTGSNACYTSCSNAKNANASGSIYLANTSSGGTSGYNCNGSSCYSVSSGATYSTLSSCQSTCGTSSVKYGCNAYSCYQLPSNSPSGYSSLSQCQNKCGLGGFGAISVWTSNSAPCSSGSGVSISVYIDGNYAGVISTYSTSTPICGDPNTNLIIGAPPGGHLITAKCGTKTWPSQSAYINFQGDCTSIHLN